MKKIISSILMTVILSSMSNVIFASNPKFEVAQSNPCIYSVDGCSETRGNDNVPEKK